MKKSVHKISLAFFAPSARFLSVSYLNFCISHLKLWELGYYQLISNETNHYYLKESILGERNWPSME